VGFSENPGLPIYWYLEGLSSSKYQLVVRLETSKIIENVATKEPKHTGMHYAEYCNDLVTVLGVLDIVEVGSGVVQCLVFLVGVK
jgi:hypothetical protein